VAQRVPHSNDANEMIAEQSLRTHFRTSRLSHHAGFQIDGPIAKRRAIFVWLLHEAQPHAGSFLPDASNKLRPKVLHKPVAGSQRECSN